MSHPQEHGADPPRRRRRRYPGTHPRRFEDRYKEHRPEAYPGIHEQVRSRGGTPAGTHVPVLVQEVMECLKPQRGEVIADCTLGYGGHAVEWLRRIGPAGRLVGFDVDAQQLARARERLAAVGPNFSTHRCNFAGVAKVLAQEGLAGFDILFADLGSSSMQLDDPARGFSYKHSGPLDMRMDDRRQQTAADHLATLPEADLSSALEVLGDEPDHSLIARAVVCHRQHHPIRTTTDLVRIILEAKRMTPQAWRNRKDARQHDLHPAARTFQALRILVNDELGALKELLRIAPACLRSGGRIGVISFHSGEDRLVQEAFARGVAAGLYQAAAAEPVQPTSRERFTNPRSRSARLRWARLPS
ncbi:MAG: 16S rRNA (cytosine(1402)-N(4))-methyltransferase RsmH [Phycisphaerae bacterium]|nr:16S rRNA (cytosine(1402)-N(4))-methyltransferase RsmH [Phycisphaerae bacterium]